MSGCASRGKVQRTEQTMKEDPVLQENRQPGDKGMGNKRDMSINNTQLFCHQRSPTVTL